MECIYYVESYSYTFVFPAVFFLLRGFSLKFEVSLRGVEMAWMALTALVYGIMWRVAAMDYFGVGISWDEIGYLLFVGAFFYVLIFLFLAADLLELRQIPDRGERRIVLWGSAAGCLLGLLPLALLNQILLTVLGLYVHYQDEYYEWASQWGLLGVFLLLLPLLLIFLTWVGSPLLCFYELRCIYPIREKIGQQMHQELVEILQRQYGLSPAMVQVMQSGYPSYNREEYGANPQWTFEYQEDGCSLVHWDAPVQQVTNEERPRRILENLAELLEITPGPDGSLQAAEAVMAQFDREGKADVHHGSLARALNAPNLQWPAQRSQTLKQFFQTRSAEVQAIAQAQLRFYVNDYKGIRAGLDGEEAVRWTPWAGRFFPCTTCGWSFRGGTARPAWRLTLWFWRPMEFLPWK